jgi:DNA polymerase III epsilon subunit-like protein
MLSYISFDTETTGVEPGSRPVEIAAIHFLEDGTVLDRFESLCNPGLPLPADVSAIHGLTAEEVAAAPSLEDTLHRFLVWMDEQDQSGQPPYAMLAHYATYDVSILSYALDLVGKPHPDKVVVCTCEMAKAIKETANNKLDTLVEHYGLVRDQAHRALADADAVRQYFVLKRNHIHHGTPWTPEWTYTSVDSLLVWLPEIIKKGGIFAFDYTDARGNQSSRRIIPYGWAKNRKGVVEFHGLDLDKGERRTFHAERVTAVAVVGA